jgi:hypothetical protein
VREEEKEGALVTGAGAGDVRKREKGGGSAV